MKKIITAAMASIMIFTTVAPSIAYAKEGLEVSENYQNEEKVDQNLEVNSNENSNEEVENTNQGEENTEENQKAEAPKLEISDAQEFKKQLSGMRDDVLNIQTNKEIQEEMKADYNEKSLEIEENIDKMSVGAIGFANIYDLDSIPDRIMLLGRLGVAIRFATTELRYKVDAAHTEIAEYVFRGLVIAASPFHTREDMKVYMEEFEALKQKLLSYPDITLEDTANLYVRSDLDVKLNKARFMKFNDLKNKSTDVIKELDREIARITNIRLKPQTTVKEIYQASDELDQAVAKAINSKEFKAPNYIIKEAKEWRAKAKKAVRDGDKRREVAKAIEETNDELLKTRPSQPKLEGLIEKYKSLLDF